MSTHTHHLFRTIATSVTAATLGGLVLIAPDAGAVAPASSSTVTIQADGTDLFGHVSSPRSSCKGNRHVVVYKQIGARGGGNDQNFASDTTEDNGDWNTGNTGTEGKFYAKVKKTAQCKADFSPTIHATR